MRIEYAPHKLRAGSYAISAAGYINRTPTEGYHPELSDLAGYLVSLGVSALQDRLADVTIGPSAPDLRRPTLVR